MERNNLISFLIGRFVGRFPDDPDPKNLEIYIDQTMISCNLPPLTDEDNQFLKDIIDEVSFSVLSAGINRKMRRSGNKYE